MALTDLTRSVSGESPDRPPKPDRPPIAPPGGWPQPRALYVHVPFCRHRCGYCNFSVVADRDDLVDRFSRAIDVELAELSGATIETVFVGGGTPTHLPPPALRRLLESIRGAVQILPDAEFSVEANPEDVDREKVTVLVEAGVNRVSLGVQSFNAKKLRTLERSHDRATAVRAIETVAVSIPNVSIDLIFAAPGESVAAWRDDVATALQTPITHLSSYALTFEKGTSFWSRRRKGELRSPAESDELEMYQHVRGATAEAGWEQYEVSNFALPGHRCRHNVAYWHGRGWHAAGPGAARFRDGRREVNHRSTTGYLKRIETGRSPVAESEPIGLEQYTRERAAFGIRMLDGIEPERLRAETGVDLEALCHDAFERGVDRGLLWRSARRVGLTERGLLFADTVAADFLG